MIDRFGIQANCILGDEMGLGKTLQTIATMAHLFDLKMRPPVLVVCPLSLVQNWVDELAKYAPSFNVLKYIGSHNEREQLRGFIVKHIKSLPSDEQDDPRVNFDVLVTSYDFVIKDELFLSKFQWRLLVVDEAHRLKNPSSVLYETLMNNYSFGKKLLLTGTPIQNSLAELWALLHFIMPKVFRNLEAFKEYYKCIEDKNASDTDKKHISEQLHTIMKPFLLRRVKEEVLKSLPIKKEMILYTGMSHMQKKYYLSILKKDPSLQSSSKSVLMNIIMNLRKCCNHPYFFDNAEPTFDGEYILGDHIITNSGKLTLLDKLLQKLHKEGSKVLIFSQMTRMLDILQDYLHFRGYSYERLDGSVRGDERNNAVKNFNSDDSTFIFLLSTRAGGLGLNLTSADTVIFYDSDWNPQQDLQAQARAHRIGQEKEVTVIRLVSSNTVEEIILARAFAKLKLKHSVLDQGNFSFLTSEIENQFSLDDIIKYGLKKLTEEDELMESDIDDILNKGKLINNDKIEVMENEHSVLENETNMYLYDGQDYSKEDNEIYESIVESSALVSGSRKPEPKPTKPTVNAEEVKRLKKEELWDKHGYSSTAIYIETEDISEDDIPLEEDEEHLHLVRGDTTKPQGPSNVNAIVATTVDNSGKWGKGGLFTAIDNLSLKVSEQYAKASKMKDIHMGDLHIIEIDKREDGEHSLFVGTIVSQSRVKGVISPINMNHLKTGLTKLAQEARKRNASVHLPRIGENIPSTNYYSIERIIRSCLSSKGIETYIYYFSKKKGSNYKIPKQPNPVLEIKANNEEVKSNTSGLFSNITFHMLSVGIHFKKLKQAIETNDGKVEYILSPKVSYIVTKSNGSKNDEMLKTALLEYPNTPLVSEKFVYDCVSYQEILDAKDYVI